MTDLLPHEKRNRKPGITNSPTKETDLDAIIMRYQKGRIQLSFSMALFLVVALIMIFPLQDFLQNDDIGLASGTNITYIMLSVMFCIHASIVFVVLGLINIIKSAKVAHLAPSLLHPAQMKKTLRDTLDTIGKARYVHYLIIAPIMIFLIIGILFNAATGNYKGTLGLQDYLFLFGCLLVSALTLLVSRIRSKSQPTTPTVLKSNPEPSGDSAKSPDNIENNS